MTVGEGVAIAAAVSSFMGTLWGASRFVRGVEARQEKAENRMAAHEELCGERYKRLEQAHEALCDQSDQRHTENVNRLGRLESKLDRVLEARHR